MTQGRPAESRGPPRRSLRRRLADRYRDVLASIYIYNEHRGYTSLDRVLEAVRARCPDDASFIAAVEKHRADEQKHYAMFRRYFERAGHMPLAVDSSCGHIDHFVRIAFGRTIEQLDTQAVVADAALFERLCRVIMLTEQRGMRQVGILLRSNAVRADPALNAIFRVIARDEPSHWMPYRDWLARNRRPQPRWRERLTDLRIHRELMFIRLPAIFLNWRLPRRTGWPDAPEPAGAGGMGRSSAT
ncbi:MAG TPA: ferritin-like domain-containing protein [Sphingobium sp.]|nr:ferritin-like domain-containing protein [Sphingobium sp.]